MFSKISQFGKNIAEDIQRNIEDANKNGKLAENIDHNINDTDTTTVDSSTDAQTNNTLPPDIRAKLNKFAKYEANYPLLLEAYKKEKAKTSQIVDFERTLQENTPVSSISEPGALIEYLNSLTMKNQMLNDELRRISKDSNHVSDSSEKELQQKVSDLEAQLIQEKEKESGLADLSNDQNGSISKDSEPNDRITELEGIIKSLQETNAKSELELARTENENKALTGQVEALTGKIKDLETSKDGSGAIVGSQEKEQLELKAVNESLSAQLKETQTAKNEAEAKLEESEKSKESLQSQLEGLKSQLESSTLSKDELQLRNRELQEKLQEAKSGKSELEQKFEALTTAQTKMESDHEDAMKKIENLSDQLEMKEMEVKSLEKDVTDLKAANEKLSMELDELKKKSFNHENQNQEIDKTSTSVIDSTIEPEPSSTASKSSKKRDKRKKKKEESKHQDFVKDTKQLPQVEDQLSKSADVKPMDGSAETIEALEREIKTLKTDYSELDSEFNRLRSEKSQDMKAKIEEVESLRDMLKDVGNDLVSARDELKELKEKVGDESIDKSHEKEMNLLKNEHSELTTKYETEKNEQEKKINDLFKEKEDFEIKFKELEEELHTCIKEKEILSTFKEEAEQKNKEAMEIKNLLDKKASTITELEKSLKNLKEGSEKKIASLEKSKAALEKSIESLKSEVSALNSIKSKHEEDLAEFGKLKKTEASLNKELSVVKSNLNHREKTITYFEKQVKEYEVLKTQLLEEITKLKASNRELKISTTTSSDQLTRLTREKAKCNELLNDANKQKDGAIEETKQLQDKISSLQVKYEGLRELKSTNTEEVELLKRKYDELWSSNKESIKKIQELSDELNENRMLLQERTKEAGTGRRLLLEIEQEQESKLTALNRKLQNAIDSKDSIQSEADMLIAKTRKELNEFKLKYSELEKSTSLWETEKLLLKKEVQALKDEKINFEKERRSSVSDSKEITQLLDKMKDSLSASEQKVREYENLNNVLKKLNDDLNSKIDRLTKNYKLVSNQLKEKQSSSPSPKPSRSSSIVSNLNHELSGQTIHQVGGINPSQSPETEAEKIPYIRNVLLGFLEHREQRQQLLPVISMLLQLNKSDEKRLVVALK